MSKTEGGSLIGTIEIPFNSKYKYELNIQTGGLLLDRVLSMRYPESYGFIPETLSEDGDALDFFVVTNEPIPPLTQVRLELLGVIEMTDNGVEDNKLICRIAGDCIDDEIDFSDITYFLTRYKSGVRIVSVGDNIRAAEVLSQARERFEKDGVQ